MLLHDALPLLPTHAGVAQTGRASVFSNEVRYTNDNDGSLGLDMRETIMHDAHTRDNCKRQ